MGATEGGAQPGIHLCSFVQSFDPALGLQSGHRGDHLRTRQPIQRGKGVSVGIDRTIPDDQRMALATAGHDGERDGELPPELSSHHPAIGEGGYVRSFSTRGAMTCGFSQVAGPDAKRRPANRGPEVRRKPEERRVERPIHPSPDWP
jgi:hypothetical protein